MKFKPKRQKITLGIKFAFFPIRTEDTKNTLWLEPYYRVKWYYLSPHSGMVMNACYLYYEHYDPAKEQFDELKDMYENRKN